MVAATAATTATTTATTQVRTFLLLFRFGLFKELVFIFKIIPMHVYWWDVLYVCSALKVHTKVLGLLPSVISDWEPADPS